MVMRKMREGYSEGKEYMVLVEDMALQGGQCMVLGRELIIWCWRGESIEYGDGEKTA